MAQIIPIVSDALQATIRRLLPSQQGFGEDLQAQNVIVPIIDLTPTAEGSGLPSYLQSAISTDETIATTENATDNVATVPGFYRMRYRIVGNSLSAGATITLTNGVSTTFIAVYSGAGTIRLENELIVFVRAGYSLQQSSDQAGYVIQSFTTQLADVNGVLSDPAGYQAQ
jgi:hypothetical protein